MRRTDLDVMSRGAEQRLSSHERIVLLATKRFKPSYAGRDRYQMTRADAYDFQSDVGAVVDHDRASLTEPVPGERFMTRREWDAAKQALIDKGMLTRIGGITQAGRSAIGDEA